MRSVEERFFEKVAFEPNTGCWIWTASTNDRGYARFSPAGRKVGVVLAHRFAYEHFRGPIPAGMTLDHGCRNEPCVNPFHTEPASYAENTRRARVRDVPKCGHTYDHKTPGDDQRCGQCRREKKRINDQQRKRRGRRPGLAA